MRTIYLLFALVLLGLASGCRYRGAVYSEYEQLALDVRASTTDANGPVKVNFGYDRGVIAFVPHRVGGDGKTGARGEAVSVISWSKTGTDVRPSTAPRGGSNTVLSVNAGLITGTAANVAAIPQGMLVTVVSDASSTNFVGVTKGSRISAAAAMTMPAFRDVLQSAAQYIWGAEGDTVAARKGRAEQVLQGIAFEGDDREDLVMRLSNAGSVADTRKLLMRVRGESGVINANLDRLGRR